MRSMPMCIYAVGVDMWRTYIGYAYVVYVWTGRIVWSIGVRYIYLISVILNVYGGYTYIRRFSATVSSFAPVVSYRSHTLYSI